MSSNPFRRSFARDTINDTPPALKPQAYPAQDSITQPIDLTVNTKVPPSVDRHVSFASPPVDSTIPAVSYPSSPESVRTPPAFPPVTSTVPLNVDHRSALQSDPFRNTHFAGQEDLASQQALQNAQQNASTSSQKDATASAQAVKSTLSRFASNPRKPLQDVEQPRVPITKPARNTIDVDAFTRLLLTGESGTLRDANGNPTDNGRAVRGGFPSDANLRSQAGSSSQDQSDDKARPAAPPPRRSKSVKKPQLSPETSSMEGVPRDMAAGQTRTIASPELRAQAKMPPPPPLARRQSQRSVTPRNEDSRTGDLEPDLSDTASIVSSTRPPPAPPARKPHGAGDRRPSTDLETTFEESGEGNAQQPDSRRSSGQRPAPPPSRNSNKRASLGLMNPPPLPPPRRGRGSSRSSIDSFRPSLSSIMGNEEPVESTRSSLDLNRSQDAGSLNIQVPNTSALLEELANLQREVDAARSRA